jgi:3D (Asp-Asp-Asp) domain-containing protein
VLFLFLQTRNKGENNLKKFSFVLSFVLIFLVAFANDSEAAASVHTVKKGDTLYKISRQYHVSVSAIKSINHLKSDLIKPNQKLKLKGTAKKTVKKVSKKSVSRSNDNVVKEFRVSTTAYTAYCRGCSGITKTGINLRKNPNLKVIAVDPRVIKLGTKVYVEGYGYAIAGDTGSAIKGNKIDVFMPNHSSALKWGRKTVKIKILR